MKSLFNIMIFLLLMTSCNKMKQHDEAITATDTPSKEDFNVSTFFKEEIPKEQAPSISFKEVEAKGILLGDSISILDLKLQNISLLGEGALVDIMGVSDSLFQKTNDNCDAFKYVKINTHSGARIIDGRHVYQISSSNEGINFEYKQNSYYIKTTEFYGIGPSDDEGLTFCNKYFEPVVLTNLTNNTTQFIVLVKNELSNEAYWNKGFPYFEFMANDGAYDQIKSVTPIKEGVILNIKREFQEGWNEFQIKLLLNQDIYKAEILNYGERNY